MKTIRIIFSTVVIFTLTTLVSAQTEQGKLLISGSTSFSMGGGLSKWKSDDAKGDPTHSFAFSFSPKAAYFFIDNLALGARFPLSINRSKDNNDNISVSSFAGFAPWVRYYFLSDQIRPFAEGSFGGGIDGYKYKPNDGESSTDNEGVFLSTLGGGVSFFLIENIAFDASINWSLTRYKDKSDNPDNVRTLYHTVIFEVGIVIFIL